MTDKRMIGIDRPLRLEWLDAAAGQLASGASERATRDYLWKLLDGVVSGDTPQSARGKTMTVISRIWLTPDSSIIPLKSRAIELIESATPGERIATHWALLVAAYPFFLDAALNIGKFLQLHGSFALTQLHRRMTEAWGDRSTLRPALQRIVRMMVVWCVLEEGDARGEFVRSHVTLPVSSPYSELLLEACLLSSNGSLSLRDARVHPALFPFDVVLSATSLRKSTRFSVHRYAPDEDIVELERSDHIQLA